MQEIACFITPHGFGHATRTIAILEALQQRHPDLHPHLFTTVPETLFADTLTHYTYHRELADIGMVQNSALAIDIEATFNSLTAFLPYSLARLSDLARQCSRCSLILCDIAPLGIAVGKMAEIPSILVENFTWDWIYSAYFSQHPGLRRHAEYLDLLFKQTSYRIQTEPLCQDAPRDMKCGPIFRRNRATKEQIKTRLNAGRRKIVLVTFGGIPQNQPDLNTLEEQDDMLFIIPGQEKTLQVGSNCLLLKRDCEIYHPDLIGAADLVVCKAGYSTIAECCQAGTRVMCIARDDFPESAPLQKYLEDVLDGVSITPATYCSGRWLEQLNELLSRPRAARAKENGADKVADFLGSILYKQTDQKRRR